MKPLKFHRSSQIIFVLIFAFSFLYPVRHAAAQETASLPGQFAYVENETRLFLVRGNVQEPLLLLETDAQQTVGYPHFSTDGRYLAYCLSSPSTEALPVLYYLDTLTLEKYKVTADGSCSYDWSPDGKILIYSTPPAIDTPLTVANGIWSYNRESREIKLLIPSDMPVIDPRWSPDGQTISYFDFCFECVGQFYTYDLTSGTKKEWSQEDNYIGPDVSWSPDGKVLAYDQALWMYSSEGERYGLYLAGSNGESRKQIYSQAGQAAFFPIWSPDGKEIAFASFESFIIGNYMNRRGDLMVVAPDGSNARKLYSSIYEVFPQAWSPDSLYLLFVEPLSVGQGSLQKRQLSLLEVGTGRVIWQTSSLGSLTADWAPLPPPETAGQEKTVPMAGKSGLLFVSSDYALAFFDPLSGRTQKLTNSFSGKEISVSPDGSAVLFGNQIISMQSQADGTVTAEAVPVVNPDSFWSIKWSPDGQKYGYVDLAGKIWMVNQLGNRIELGEGNTPPDWSYDGRWMAYCDKAGHLWIAETGKPADWIVQQDRCQVSWSPTQSILAYATFPPRDFTNQANGTAFLYDPLSGRTQEVAQNLSEVDWSADGKLLSIQRITWMGASNYGFSLSAVNPESGQELFIDEFNAEEPGNHGWVEQTNAYVAGKYRFQADLLAKEQLADLLFDVTRDGEKLLTGSGTEQDIQVSCHDVKMNIDMPIAEAHLKERPGVYASFSPDGQWILVSNDEIGKSTDWIAQCNTEPVSTFETLAIPYKQYFSTDSHWLVMEQTNASGEEVSRISLRELSSGQTKEVPAGLNTGSVWFEMPDAPAAPAATGTVPVSPSQAAIFAEESTLINLQSDTPPINDKVRMLSILLWAGSLVAIVVLMLYLWRRSAAPQKQVKTPAGEIRVEEQPALPVAAAPGPAPEEVQTAFQRGVDLVRAGNADEGIVELTKVITAEPGNNIAWFWLGIGAARQQNYRSAERCFLQAKRYGHPEADKALEWLKDRRK